MRDFIIKVGVLTDLLSGTGDYIKDKDIIDFVAEGLGCNLGPSSVHLTTFVTQHHVRRFSPIRHQGVAANSSYRDAVCVCTQLQESISKVVILRIDVVAHLDLVARRCANCEKNQSTIQGLVGKD